ncbi:MAG: hypothetical protein KKD28_05130 [Chloroflexi bacterium]|nr:hypothetical protein [Chloroflexota bacterium]MBU1660839.1 hypothetical protein [Chloroflexota bacterium]
MSVMAVPATVERVANALHISADKLMQRSVRAFLRQEMRAAQMDIADLQDRYGVMDAVGLQKEIEQGEIYSHPAWENSIEWEQLESHLTHLERLLDDV